MNNSDLTKEKRRRKKKRRRETIRREIFQSRFSVKSPIEFLLMQRKEVSTSVLGFLYMFYCRKIGLWLINFV